MGREWDFLVWVEEGRWRDISFGDVRGVGWIGVGLFLAIRRGNEVLGIWWWKFETSKSTFLETRFKFTCYALFIHETHFQNHLHTERSCTCICIAIAIKQASPGKDVHAYEMDVNRILYMP